MLEVIGTTMIVSTRMATRIPAFSGVPLNSGMKPRWRWSQGSRSCPTNGPRTRIPQRPSTTLGIAASNSTREAITVRAPRGASSLR